MAALFGQPLRPFSSPVAVTATHSYHFHSSCSTSKVPTVCLSSSSSRASSSSMDGGEKRFEDFPYLSGPYKALMVELVSAVEARLGSQLLPCTLPPDVQYFHNQTSTAEGSLHIRSGLKSSLINFILGSWLHCEVPSGELNIMSISAYLSPSSDAPNFLMDIIQSSPTSLVFILDLPPRKDLVLHPDYLQIFYEDTQLDSHKQRLEKLPEVQPYYSSLYIRSLISPTAILVRIGTGAGETERMEKVVRDHVSPIAKEVLGIWLDRCACGGRELEETERKYLSQRDRIIRSKSIEIDLSATLPRLFGQDVAARVLGAIQGVFNS